MNVFTNLLAIIREQNRLLSKNLYPKHKKNQNLCRNMAQVAATFVMDFKKYSYEKTLQRKGNHCGNHRIVEL